MSYPRLSRNRVSEPAVLYRQWLDCPHCHHQIPLTVKDLDWAVHSPSDAATRLLAQTRGLEQERLIVLSLNTRNKVLDQHVAYIGNVSAALVRTAEIFREPVRLNAAGIVLAHTHPSNDPTPSPDDLHLTAEVIAAGKLLAVDVLDHIILAGDKFVSLRDRGIMFTR